MTMEQKDRLWGMALAFGLCLALLWGLSGCAAPEVLDYTLRCAAQPRNCN